MVIYHCNNLSLIRDDWFYFSLLVRPFPGPLSLLFVYCDAKLFILFSIIIFLFCLLHWCIHLGSFKIYVDKKSFIFHVAFLRFYLRFWPWLFFFYAHTKLSWLLRSQLLTCHAGCFVLASGALKGCWKISSVLISNSAFVIGNLANLHTSHVFMRSDYFARLSMIVPATWILFLVALPRSRSTRQNHHGRNSQNQLSPNETPPSLTSMQQFDLGDETHCSNEVCSICDIFTAAMWNLSVCFHAHGYIV